jgi:LysR family cyn operon transcriptional activator
MLEKEVGAQLFERNRKPIKLTYAGKKYLDGCLKIQAIQTSMREEINDIVDGNIGTITLGLPTYISRCISHVVLPEFRNLYPQVELKLIERSTRYLEDLIIKGVADYAIVYNPTLPDLEYKLIAKEPLYLAMPPLYAIRHGFQKGVNFYHMDLEDIKDYPFILLKKGHGLRIIADSLFESCNLKPNINFETDDIIVAHQLANAGIGFSIIIPTSINIIDSNKCGYLCGIKGFSGTRNIYICYRKDRYVSVTAKSLIELVVNSLSNDYCIS